MDRIRLWIELVDHASDQGFQVNSETISFRAAIKTPLYDQAMCFPHAVQFTPVRTT